MNDDISDRMITALSRLIAHCQDDPMFQPNFIAGLKTARDTIIHERDYYRLTARLDQLDQK